MNVALLWQFFFTSVGAPIIAPTVTTVYPDFHLMLGGTAFATGFGEGFGGGMVVVDDDVVVEPIICEYGIRTNDPSDRVAGAGELHWALDNSEYNSGDQLGWYALFNANRRTAFDFNVAVQLALSCPEVNGGIPYYKFYGKLAEAPATPGVYGERLTRCIAYDIFDDFGKIDEPEIDVQVNKRSDEIVTTLFDAMTTQPLARDIETGSDILSFALDGGTGQKLKVRERIQQVCLSEVGACYPIGSPIQPGTVRLESRQHRSRNPDVLFTLDDSGIIELPVPASRADLYSKIEVTVYPTNDVSTATPIVLYSLQTTQIAVQPGETNDSIFGPYRDPVSNDQIGGLTSSMTDPVAFTDYLMNTEPNGTGSDLTPNFTVTTSRTGLGVRFSITNHGSQVAYVTRLQQQGIPIYRFEALITRPLATTYGERVLEFVMPFQNNLNVGKDAADFFGTIHSQRIGRPPWVRFLANDSAAFMEAALVREPGDRIKLSEEVTGLDEAEFTINGCRYELYPGGLLWCTWFLEPALSQDFWLIGVADASNIGVSTVPGF